MTKIAVGVLGASGIVGMQAVHLLADHPLFELTFVAASKASAGKNYREVVETKGGHASEPPDLLRHDVEALLEAIKSCRLTFSCLSSKSALTWDERYAKEGFIVISNASAHRACVDVPVIIPEINPEHLKVLSLQQKRRGWKGVLIAKPNCSLQSYMIPLTPLHRRFCVSKVLVMTLQAMSGAGFSGQATLDMDDNIIPFIAGEEEKTEREPQKIWGRVEDGGIIADASITLSAHCTRVPITDGHLACLSVEFREKPSRVDIIEAWRDFTPMVQSLKLPSAPQPVIHFMEAKDRPQVRLDRNLGKGMAISVGRLRSCPLLDMRFVSLSHNTVRGAAGGALLIAELLYKQGFLENGKTESYIFSSERELSLSRG